MPVILALGRRIRSSKALLAIYQVQGQPGLPKTLLSNKQNHTVHLTNSGSIDSSGTEESIHSRIQPQHRLRYSPVHTHRPLRTHPQRMCDYLFNN